MALIRSPNRRIEAAAAAGSLRYSWVGEENGKPTLVTYRLESFADGTRFTFEHTGFTGVGGYLMARLLGAVRTKMLTVSLPAVLNDVSLTG